MAILNRREQGQNKGQTERWNGMQDEISFRSCLDIDTVKYQIGLSGRDNGKCTRDADRMQLQQRIYIDYYNYTRELLRLSRNRYHRGASPA